MFGIKVALGTDNQSSFNMIMDIQFNIRIFKGEVFRSRKATK